MIPNIGSPALRGHEIRALPCIIISPQSQDLSRLHIRIYRRKIKYKIPERNL